MRYALLGVLLRCLTIAALPGLLLEVAPAQDAQNTQGRIGTVTNPPGLSFVLRTKNAQNKLFHLGEMIEIEEDYSSSIPGQYLLLQNPMKVEGGSSSNLTVLPSAAVIDRVQQTGWVSAAAILHARCVGEGIGSGGGSGCGDCDGVYKLGIEPIHFPYVLNYRFAIAAPGHYTIQARAANVVSTGDVSKPVPVSSTQLEIEIVRDDNWSHQQLRLAVDGFEEAQRNYLLNPWNASESDPGEFVRQTETAQEMDKSAEIIRFLDTEESLREAVRLFDGSPRMAMFENVFLKAILESSHRDLAVPLLANRMVSEDFLASVDFLDILTAMTIQIEEPIVFDRSDPSSLQQLNPRTLEILREYVLALGRSLPSKGNAVRESGIETFKYYASKEYCTNEPLIEKRLADQILLQAGRHHQ